jgi:hypothetical protein
MRPVYETKQDLENEKAVAMCLSEKWNCNVEKTKKFYPCDYSGIRRGNVVSFLEIKCRPQLDHDDRDSYMTGALKICSCLSIAERLKRPFILVVSFNDGIYYTNTFPTDFIIMGGRRDRNDPDDIEPCMLIPMTNFRRLD